MFPPSRRSNSPVASLLALAALAGVAEQMRQGATPNDVVNA